MTDILSTFKTRITAVEKSLSDLNAKPPHVTTRADYAFDYQEGRQKYLANTLQKSVSDLKRSAWELTDLRAVDKENEVAVLNVMNTLTALNSKAAPEEITKTIAHLKKVVGAMRGRAPSPSSLVIDPPQMPEEVRPEITADLDELKKCFEFGAFRSCVVLCGRILETALHRKYYEATGNDLLETAPDIGLGKLIAKLKESNVQFDPGLTQQIHLVNQVRVFSVHKKQDAFYPSKAQAHAMILYTVDVLKKLF